MIFSFQIFAIILSGRADPVLEQEGGPESILRSLQAVFSRGPFFELNQIHSIISDPCFELLELMKQNKLL